MRIYSVQTLIRALGLALAVLLWTCGSVRAQSDPYYTWNNTGTPVGVNISFTGSGGQQPTTAGSFTVQQYTTGATPTATGSTFQAFCIDVWHTQQTGTTFFSGYNGNTTNSIFFNGQNAFAGTPYSLASTGNLTGSSPAVNIGSLVVSSLSNPTLANELSYLGTVFNAIQSATGASQDANALGAMQLALWSIVTRSFTSTASGTMLTDYNKIATLLAGGSSWSYTGTAHTVSIAAYNSSDTYTGATVIQVNSGPGTDPNSDQNVIFWSSSDTGPLQQVQSAPEPSTLAIAGLGALAFVGYGLRRRKASGA
jgi:hypothetical protein